MHCVDHLFGYGLSTDNECLGRQGLGGVGGGGHGSGISVAFSWVLMASVAAVRSRAAGRSGPLWSSARVLPGRGAFGDICLALSVYPCEVGVFAAYSGERLEDNQSVRVLAECLLVVGVAFVRGSGGVGDGGVGCRLARSLCDKCVCLKRRRDGAEFLGSEGGDEAMVGWLAFGTSSCVGV